MRRAVVLEFGCPNDGLGRIQGGQLERQIDGGDSDTEDKKNKAGKGKDAANKKLVDTITKAVDADKTADVSLNDDGSVKSVKIEGHGRKKKDPAIVVLAEVAAGVEAQGADDEKAPGKNKATLRD